MRSNTIIVLLGLSCVCLSLAQTTFEDCCYRYVTKTQRIQRQAVNYRQQVVDGGCNIPATILILRTPRTVKTQRVVCVDPHAPWVVHLIKKIDKKKGKHDRYQPKTLHRS
ncbi:C-C motif chemokine 20-like [Pungitius pungitius]|uniref:C-C motif chemokine 20-like n=1 Tax=Pungitius pungitius TaxID=134920 RepID=UPI002E10F50D